MFESDARRRRNALLGQCRSWGLPIALLLCAGTAASQQAAPALQPQAFRVEIFDPEFEKLVDPRVKLQTIASGFGFSDGPVWVRGTPQSAGYLLVSSIIGKVIYKVTAAGGLRIPG